MSPDTDSSYHRLTKGRRPEQHRQVQEEKNMVDQVKVVPMIRLRLNSRYGAISQTDISAYCHWRCHWYGVVYGVRQKISLAGPSIIFVYMIIGFMLFS